MNLNVLIEKGWQETKTHFWLYAAVLLISFSLLFGLSTLLQLLHLSRFFIQVILYILQVWLAVGWTIIFLKRANDKPARIQDLFMGGPYLASSMGATLCYFVMIFVGFFLLIFPACIWGIQFMFYQYLIVDKNMTAFQSLKESSKMTKGLKWKLFPIVIVLEIVAYAGLLMFVMGIFWTLPVSYMAMTFLYISLKKK
ncbi:MAG: hypothetical protein KKH98_09280 [Spirochaetes bacterium]|nr:hypothetical protein [Spirochaetota bacterium]